MRLDCLRIAHFSKKRGAPETLLIEGAVFLDSCQRVLWIYADESESEEQLAGYDYLSGVNAYRFLLRVASGLESEVLGETDVFGQLKKAWREAHTGGLLDPIVDFWMGKVFEDTKEIRAQHLERLGGVSYGSLARKYFSETSSLAQTKTLIIGAGSLARSVAPYFAECAELLVLNRSLARANELKSELLSLHPQAKVTVLDRASALAQVDRVIFCVPESEESSAQRYDWLKQSKFSEQSVLHLGAVRAQAFSLAKLQGAAFLDDIYALQKSQDEARSLQIIRAERACDERAKLRGLSHSMSVAHGWEDLAIFA